MTVAKQIGIVLCRLAAAVLLVQSIQNLGYVLPSALSQYGEIRFEFSVYVLLNLTPALVAICLWVFADRISTVPGEAGRSRVEAGFVAAQVLRVGTTLIGVYLVATAIIAAAGIEFSDWIQRNISGDMPRSMSGYVAHLIGGRASYIVQLLIGIVLVLGRNQIAALVTASKYAGVNRS